MLHGIRRWIVLDIAVQSWLIHWNIMTNETKVFVVSWSVECIIELPFVIFLRMKQKSPSFFSSSDDFKHKKSEIKITSKMKIFVWLIVFASIWRSRVLMGSHMSIPSRIKSPIFLLSSWEKPNWCYCRDLDSQLTCTLYHGIGLAKQIHVHFIPV